MNRRQRRANAKPAHESVDHAAVAALNDRGNSLKSLGRLAEALASYDSALALDSGFLPAWNNRGATLKAMNRLEEALLSYDRALALNPDLAIVQTNRADRKSVV